MNEKYAIPIVTANVDPSLVRALGGTGGARALDGWSVRHDWGDWRGEAKLNLTWDVVQRGSRVFAAASEGAADGGMFIGLAKFTIHNVAAYGGGVHIWINIDWNEPIRLHINYLVLN